MAKQTIDGITSPEGGFKTGGWYGGRQYWNGTLSAKGVINSQSNQQGAGQAVSDEVNRATSVAAGLPANANPDYVASNAGNVSGGNQTFGGNPTSAEQLPGYLDKFQTDQFKALTIPDFKIPTASELKATLTPNTPAPTPLNRLELLNQQKASLGVVDLETELNTIKTEENQIKADLRATTGAEEGKSVALGVMAGRITEEQRQANTKLDYLNVRKATLVDELTTKYNAINTYIQYAGLDYQDAVKAYEGEFDKNIQIQNLISGFRKEAWTYATDAIKLNETIKQNNIDNARANLTTITNAITNGQMSYANLPAEQKLQIQKLEIQSGLPVGTVAGMQLSAKDKILGWSEDKTQAMVLDGNGGFKLIATGFKKSPTATETKTAQTLATTNEIKAAASHGESFSDILRIYQGNGLDTTEIFNLYSANSPNAGALIGGDKSKGQYTKEELQNMGIKFASDGTPSSADEIIKLKNAGVIK